MIYIFIHLFLTHLNQKGGGVDTTFVLTNVVEGKDQMKHA